MTAYGHTSRLPKLAEYIAGTPRQPQLIDHLSGTAYGNTSPLTTSPRIVAFRSAGLGKVHFHHILYANGSPRPHRPLVVRTMRRKAQLWDLERTLLDKVVADAKAAAGAGMLSNTSSDGEVQQEQKKKLREALLAGTRWAPLTDFADLIPHNEAFSSSATPSSSSSSPSPSTSSSQPQRVLMTRREEMEAKVRLARERLALQKARKAGGDEAAAKGTDDASKEDAYTLPFGDDASAASGSSSLSLGEVPAILRIPRKHLSVGRPQPRPEHDVDVLDADADAAGAVRNLGADSSESGAAAAIEGSSSSSSSKKTVEELIAEEQQLARRASDDALAKHFTISWAVGERLRCEWLQSVWDPRAGPSEALARANNISSDSTAAFRAEEEGDLQNPILRYGGASSSSSSSAASDGPFAVPTSVGITRPEAMGHRIEFSDRVRASDAFVDYHFGRDISAQSAEPQQSSAEAGGSSAPSPIFHHPSEESFLFPTARLLIRLYVPSSARAVCERKNRESAASQLGSGRKGSSFTSFTDSATAGEAYGLERPFHDVRVIDGDCVYIPRGWGYELFRETRRTVSDTQTQAQRSAATAVVGGGGEPMMAVEDETSGAIVYDEPKGEAIRSNSGNKEGGGTAASPLHYSSTDHFDGRGVPSSAARHAQRVQQPADKYNWHRYQMEREALEAEENGGEGVDAADRGLVPLADRYGYKSYGEAKRASAGKGATSDRHNRAPSLVAGKRLVHVDVPIADLIGGGEESSSSSSPSSSLLMSCDCFRVAYQPYPHLSPAQERAYLPAMYTTNVDDFYARGGNDPNRHYVH